MATRVMNVHEAAYVALPANLKQYIGRAGHGFDGYYGNSFVLAREAVRGSTIEKYRVWFLNRIATDPKFKENVLALKGKALGCFCAPRACHGDVMAQWLDQQP